MPPASRASFQDQTGVQAAVLGGAFLALAAVSNRFAFPPHPSAVLWLPSGMGLAFLLRNPPRRWPALLAAIFVAELVAVPLRGFPIPAWVIGLWGLANCLRALVGAWLMRRFVGTEVRLARRWEIAGLLLFGGVVSPVVSATLGSLGYTFSAAPSSFAVDWVHWWLSDGLGAILVAPLLLTWTPEAFRPRQRQRLAELGIMLVLTALAAHLIFGQSAPVGVRATLAYASFPFVLWGALRMGPVGAASTSAVVAMVALSHTFHGLGPFGAMAASFPERMHSLQMFLAILALTALTLAAVVTERWRAKELQHLLVDAGRVLATSMDIQETFARVADLVVPRACDGFALWRVGEDGLLERMAQAGWSSAREARLRGHLRPLPATSRRWSFQEGTAVLVPLVAREHVLGVLVLVRDERARFAGAEDVALAEELAHRFAMAMETARLYAEAQQAIMARNDFITIAAHELRTPLTTLTLRVRSLGGQLRQECGSEPVHEKVRAMSRQLGRLAQLVERVLDVGRITTRRLELQREQVDVTELVEQVVEAFAEEAEQAGSTLRVEAEAGLRACWDAGRVEQALANLMTNALKFGAGGPIEVHATAEGPWVRLAVRDHGIGIAPGALERIFGRFERAVSSRGYGGLGLGLFLTRWIAESHGGTIQVESQPGQGSTFVLQLPSGVQPVAGAEPMPPAPV